MPGPDVLHVFKDAYPPTFGGVEQHIWDVSRSLGGEFRFEVLTASRCRRRVEGKVEGVRIVRVPEYGRLLSTPLTPAWGPALARAGGTVHVHLPLPVAEAVVVARRPRGRVVAGFYAEVARNPRAARLYAPLQQRFLSQADRIVVSSDVVGATSPALSRHQDRVVVIPFGVDPEEWPAAPGRVAEIRAAHPGPIVLFLGRLVYYKGVDVLIEAMAGVGATLLVVGDGPERSRLAQAAAAAATGRPGRVLFTGSVSNEERSAYYAAADVFVLPAVSRAETFGIAMLEAMSFGTPAISTDVGTGTSWVNRHGETGLVVRPADPAALAGALRTLLADDRLRRELGDGAARRAAADFSKKVMLERLGELYRSLA